MPEDLERPFDGVCDALDTIEGVTRGGICRPRGPRTEGHAYALVEKALRDHPMPGRGEDPGS